ncbi:hypothetical protein HAX54_004534, partial [Datura stramonium]|nr:hypothetical protein [Datura stramonium]
KVVVPLFLDKKPSSAKGVVSVEKKRDVDAPKSKLKKNPKAGEMTRYHENQLQRLAQNLPALIQRSVKKVMKDVFYNLNKLCSCVDVVEGAVSYL